MSAPHDRADDERDAWLSAALRHAPDAQVRPPTTLSDTILRQARAAARGAPGSGARSSRGFWAAGWNWLARPPVAAGFASLMIATLIGLIWWDRPMDQTLERPSAEGATQAARDASTRMVQPDSASSEAGGARQAPTVPSAPTLATPRAERSRAPRAQSPASVAPAAPAPILDRRAPAPAAPAAPADKAPAEPRDEPTALASGALARPAAKAAAPQAAARMSREDSVQARPAALAALLDSIVTQPERWSWQRGERHAPMNPALQRWLLQLDHATTGRWQDGGAAPTDAAPLHLYRDGAPVATLRLGGDGIWLAPASQANLPPAAISGLKQALDDATR